MKIGIDIDNTITDTLPLLKKYCKKYNDEVVKRKLKMNEKGYITSNLYDWTKEEENGFFQKYMDEVRMNAKLKLYAKEVINSLKQEHEIYIITARKTRSDKDVYELSKDYLDKNEITYDVLVVECENKLEYCLENKIDVMIDDEPQNINAISKKLPVIALKGIMNEECSGKNIIKVDNWKEVYQIINRMEENHEFQGKKIRKRRY